MFVISIFVLHYSLKLNKLKLTFDAQYKIVRLALLTYLLVALALALALKMLAWNPSVQHAGLN